MIIIAAVQALGFLCAFAVTFILGGCVVTGFKFHTLSLLSSALQPGRNFPSDSHTMGSLTHLKPNAGYLYFFPTLSNLLLFLLYVLLRMLCQWLVFLFGTVL